MHSHFTYLIDKIRNAEFVNEPFRHIEIFDFLNEDDFRSVTAADEINIPICSDDYSLFDELFEQGYKLVPFPGAVADHNEYVKNRSREWKTASHSTTESAGVVLRLVNPKSEIIRQLKDFIESDQFNEVLANKFDVNIDECSTDGGIQKYLDEYEISPHPDIRKKAATFMVNINNSENSENINHHTHYLTFKPEREYISEYWKGNPSVERCWVPWDWCKTVKQQSQNNSFIAFSPSSDTLHAVKASYDHLLGQRTQLYGNVWYKDDDKTNFSAPTSRLDWWDFNFQSEPITAITGRSLLQKLSRLLKKDDAKNSNRVDASRRKHY